MARSDLDFYYEGLRLPRRLVTPERLDAVRGLTLTPEDIIVATYPKCGESEN